MRFFVFFEEKAFKHHYHVAQSILINESGLRELSQNSAPFMFKIITT